MKKMTKSDSPGVLQIVSESPEGGVLFPTAHTPSSGSTTVTPGWKKARRMGGSAPKKNSALKKR